MKSEKLLFKESTTYLQLLEVLDKNIEPIHVASFFPETFAMAKQALNSATFDTRLQKKIKSFATRIDLKMNHSSQANKNAFIKLPTLICGALYMCKYPSVISGYTCDELQTLALYSTTMPLPFFKQANQFFSQELVSEINQKTTDYQGRNFLMHLTEKYFEQGQTPQQITAYYKSSTLDELLEDFTNYEIQKEEQSTKEFKGQNKRSNIWK